MSGEYHKQYRGERPAPFEVANLLQRPLQQSFEYKGWDIMFGGWREEFNSFRILGLWVATTSTLPGMWVSTTEGSCRYYESKLDPIDGQESGLVITPWHDQRHILIAAALLTLLDKLDTQPKPGA